MEAVVADNARKSRRPQVGAFLVLAGLLTSMLALLAPSTVGAEPLSPGTLGNFENEGDQDDATLNTGTIDWETVKTDPRITQWALIHDDGDVDTADSTFIDSAKENDPSTWACAAAESPPKDDIFRLYLASQITEAAQFLHIGYVREKPTGDTDINVEFNRATGDFACPGGTGRLRTRDDLMISFTFSGGADPSIIEVFRWDPTLAADNVSDPAPVGLDNVAGDGHWDKVALAPNVAAGADNAAYTGGDKPGELPKITDQFFDDGVLDARQFGELTLDLGGLFGAGLLGCPGLGFANIHSRASHSFSSDLKDVFPETPFNLSNCAKIKIKKVDNSQPPVATEGAVYGLYDSLAKAQAVANQTDADAKAAAVSYCTTGADGTCLLTNVDPAKDYWITEITPPAGLLPSTEIQAVDDTEIDPFELVDLTGDPFVNNVPVANVEITKRLFNDTNGNSIRDEGEALVTPDQLSDLDGITFELQQGGVTAKTHPANADAECTITGGTGKCTISSVKLGTYDIEETLNPNGPSGVGVGASPTVVVDENGETVTAFYDNPLSPIDINLEKAGPDTANVGDEITYTFDVTTTGVPLTITELVEVVDIPNGFDDRCDAAPLTGPDKSTTIDPDNDSDSELEVGEKWRWTCRHLVTLADATDGDGADLLNKAHVEGKDDVGREVEDDDTHKVVILLPGVQLGKVADDDIVEAGDDLGFKITVTNLDDGEPPAEGVANNVVVTDELPGDLDWEVADDSDLPEGADCDIDEENVLECDLGDLDPVGPEEAPQVTIHVVAPTTEADCGPYVNIASATVENGDDPDDATASSRVRCPIEIDLDKTGDTIAHVGDTVDYEFTVTNVGGEDLVDVELTDPECNEGTITLVDDGDGDATLAAGTWDGDSFEGGEVWAYTCQRTITADDVVVVDGQDFALNTGEVTAEDEDGRPVDDTDPHEVLIITPDIEIVKTVDDDTPNVGQTVTFTYVVTNTGNTTLFGIDVVDDVLGPIGTIDELEPGASATLTKTMVVATDSPTRNVAVADGEDVLGEHVDDDDDAEITIVAGVVIPRPLPQTGADIDRLLALAGALLVLGGLLLLGGRPAPALSRRRR